MEETYYSIGGGFVMTARELAREAHGGAEAFHDEKAAAGYPYPFGSAAEMLEMGRASGKTIAEMKWANEMRAHRRGGGSPPPRRRLAGDGRLHRARACAWRANCPAACA
jgi:hypothetical protein